PPLPRHPRRAVARAVVGHHHPAHRRAGEGGQHQGGGGLFVQGGDDDVDVGHPRILCPALMMRSSPPVPLLFPPTPPPAPPPRPAPAPPPAPPPPATHRIELAGPDGKPLPYSVEIPADWQLRPAPELKGVWLLPAGADPQKEPRAILVRASPADLRDPEA